jgi:pimeloyl-ACP methyl ester carboxylesterase
MLLALALTFSAPPAVALPPRLVGEFVEIPAEAGTLKGIIDLPPKPGPWPVVILHAGSGPTDRDGNSPGLLLGTDCLKKLGRALAAEGIAVLRIDKRGIGASRSALKREEDIRFDTYADDVVAWTRFLRKNPRFTKVGFVGHSEGALIGLVAAKEAKFDAYVSLCGMGRTYPELLREQLKKNLSADLYKTSEEIIKELEAGHAVKEVPKSLASLFRPSVQPYLISAFKYDPAKLIAELKCPVEVVSGSTDIQVMPIDAERLGEANPGAKVVTVKGMNHVLKAAEGKVQLAQLQSYLDPSVPLHPRLVDEVGGFLKPVLTGK